MLRIAGAVGLRLVDDPVYDRQHQGIVPGGATDRWSLAWARWLVGDRDGAVLEWSLSGLRARFDQACWFGLAGAPAAATLDGRAIDSRQVQWARAGAELLVAPSCLGCRGYLAVTGGLLAASGDWRYAADRDVADRQRRRPPWSQSGRWAPRLGRLRVLPGPEWDPACAAALSEVWRVDPRSDAGGLRLAGAALPLDRFDIRSAPVADGTVQATAGGLIVLLRDRQTIGGYPRLLQLVDADIDCAAQLRPDAVCRFDLVDEAEAAAIGAERLASCRGYGLPLPG